MHIALIGCGEVGRSMATALSSVAGIELTICEKFQTPIIEAFIQTLGATPQNALGAWLGKCDVVFSCVVGNCALEVAEAASEWMRSESAYLDVTTASPEAMREAEAHFGRCGGNFLDVAIMGAIASNGIATPLLIAGDISAPMATRTLQLLKEVGAPVKWLEHSRAGDAATLKLLRSVFTKGMEALAVECLVCAEHFGVRDRLYEVLGDIDRAPLKDFLNMLVTTHLIHAERRWHEVDSAIAQLEAADLTPLVMFGVRKVFERTAQAEWKKHHHDAMSVSIEDALMELKAIIQSDSLRPTASRLTGQLVRNLSLSHFLGSTKMPTQEQLTTLKTYGTATIHEVQGQTGAMASNLKPLDPTLRLVGRALTVDCFPGDNLIIHYAITQAKPGDVLVIDAKGFTEGGPWGDILTLAAQKAGIQGLVIDGMVRDADTIIECGFPVFSKGLSIKGTNKVQPGRINVPITCGGVFVRPGDIMVGDRDGLVVVDPERVTEVIEASQTREDKEERMRQQIEQGRTTVELLDLDPILERLGVR